MRAAWLLVAGCAIGAPPGFSTGDRWTFPLVDPLSDGRLLTTAYVNDRGPFVFAIDPDAPITVVDANIVGDERSSHQGPRVVDELDVSHPRFYVPLGSLRVGDLTIHEPTVELSDHPGAFDAGGRHVSGVLGKDVLADSLVFGFDRDRGIAWLETHDVFHAPVDAAAAIHYHTGSPRRPDLVIRKLATVTVGGHDYDMHVDLGDVSSQLRRDAWAALATEAWGQDLIDETGTHRTTDVVARGTASVGGLANEVGFVDYVDRRWSTLPGEPDGTLGLDFFRPYSVIADWHHEVVYATPRHDDRALRLSRWPDLHPERAHVELADAKLRVSRDGDGPIEIVLAAPASAPGTVLPRVYVEMPAGVDRIEADLEPRYAGATLEVVDANPLLRDCPTGAGCVLSDSPLPP